MTWRELSVEQLLTFKSPLLIDVRSPHEHSSENIPDSINVPILDDEERARVGTVYVQEGEARARILALDIISPKLPALIKQIIALRQQGQTLVVHCWRGGLRSEAIASFLSIVGIDCWRLSGGYKAWRNHILKDLKEANFRFTPVVLHGLTGAGKTNILQELQSRGLAICDLEALANHRGSAFGSMRLGNQPTQKNFEAMLWKTLRQVKDCPVFLEAESRKIGKLNLPDFLVEHIEKGTGKKILVTASLPSRAEQLVKEYMGNFDSQTHDELLQAVANLKERLGTKKVEELTELVTKGDLHTCASILLSDYYDPLYMRHVERHRPYDLEVSGEHLGEAADAIEKWLASVQASA